MSDETIVTDPATGGQKGSKLARYDLLPAEALEQVAVHYGVGARKYADHNWRRGYKWSLSFSAMMRHAWAFWRGEDIDPETGSPHMAAVAFHALSLLTFVREHPGGDDRYEVAEAAKNGQPPAPVDPDRVAYGDRPEQGPPVRAVPPFTCVDSGGANPEPLAILWDPDELRARFKGGYAVALWQDGHYRMGVYVDGKPNPFEFQLADKWFGALKAEAERLIRQVMAR